MAPNTSEQVKQRIVNMKITLQMKYIDIHRNLASEGINVSTHTISKVCSNYIKHHIIARKGYGGGAAPKITKEIKDFIDKRYTENDELTAKDLAIAIEEKFKVTVCNDTIRKNRRALGWVKTGPRYAQLVRFANRTKRVQFADHVLWARDDFANVIFSDECTVMMEAHAKLCFRKISSLDPPKLKPTAKHPSKVHIWAGISKRGKTAMVIFDGIMLSDFYITILKIGLMPFISAVYPDGHRFQQDNDPKHTSGAVKAFIEKHNINWWQTPPESPDLNPIENVWHELKHHLRKNIKPRTKQRLVEGITDFWENHFSKDKCIRYIEHLHTVLPQVLIMEGQATGY
jgi:transposase